MGAKKAAAVGVPIAVILTVIGSMTLSFVYEDNDTTVIDNSINTDNSVTDNSQTSENTYVNTVTGEVIEQGALFLVCLQDPIPQGYEKACEDR